MLDEAPNHNESEDIARFASLSRDRDVEVRIAAADAAKRRGVIDVFMAIGASGPEVIVSDIEDKATVIATAPATIGGIPAHLS